ncbi:unnamed protein product [Staurois parvus]|uniref:Uncharacterized protein n=1 Tax=Staurois parvus TaxID=386267 RepID=A0ABN9B1G7_9NEOB|nr:unnamed protein product [Staurois parvus]
MGPCTASSCCCQVQSVSWVPVRPPIAAVSIATLCHVPLSGLLTLLVVSIFVIGCCMASHCCCLHRHTVAPHSGFGPVTAQMSEVCARIEYCPRIRRISRIEFFISSLISKHNSQKQELDMP